jgi:hypothetical protein
MNNMKQKITVLLVGFLLTLGISSCVKDSAPALGDIGKTIVKFNEGPRMDFYYLPFSGTKTETITFTRDVNSTAVLNKPLEVVLLEDPTLVPAGYTELPAANFTYTVDPGVIITSGKITAVRFAAGELSKKIKINLIGSAWTNLSTKYAKAYKVTDAGGNGNIASAVNGGMIVTFGIKNIYDGIYSIVSGTVTRYTAPGVPAGDAISGGLAGQPDIILSTSGQYSVSIPNVSTAGGLYWSYPNNSMVSGVDGKVIVVDPATNLTTISSTQNVTLTNMVGEPNYYDPATKTFYLSFIWNPTSTVRTYQVVLKYKGPRP